MILSQLRNNPILAHYSPFSPSRRFRAVIALILYAAAVIAFNVFYIVGPGQYIDGAPTIVLLLETASLAVLPSLIFLALLGAIGAKAGGADVFIATTRVTFWGAFAMALTAGIGALVGTAV